MKWPNESQSGNTGSGRGDTYGSGGQSGGDTYGSGGGSGGQSGGSNTFGSGGGSGGQSGGNDTYGSTGDEYGSGNKSGGYGDNTSSGYGGNTGGGSGYGDQTSTSGFGDDQSGGKRMTDYLFFLHPHWFHEWSLLTDRVQNPRRTRSKTRLAVSSGRREMIINPAAMEMTTARGEDTGIATRVVATSVATTSGLWWIGPKVDRLGMSLLMAYA